MKRSCHTQRDFSPHKEPLLNETSQKAKHAFRPGTYNPASAALISTFIATIDECIITDFTIHNTEQVHHGNCIAESKCTGSCSVQLNNSDHLLSIS